MIREKIRENCYLAIIYDKARYSIRKYQIQRDIVGLVKKLYKQKTGNDLDLTNPLTYNEKLQWIKLYWYDSLAALCADKLAVREYVKEKGLGYILNDLIAVYDKVDEIDIKSLPEKFVLKANHGSGWNIICADKSKINWKKTKNLLQRWMHANYYYETCEWVYKDIKPKIICEKFLEDDSIGGLKDYKIFCFDGEPKLIQVDLDRNTIHKRNIYDLTWNYIPVSIKYPTAPEIKVPKPANLDEMLLCAKVLSNGFPHVRVDFYSVNGKTFFGELTFIHGAGYEKITPESYNLLMGSWFKLPLINSCKGNAEN